MELQPANPNDSTQPKIPLEYSDESQAVVLPELQPTVQDNSPVEENAPVKVVYKKTKYRFVILLLFLMACFCNVFLWLNFAPIQTQLTKLYDTSLSYINFGTILISNIVYAPSMFVTNYIIHRFGFKVGVIMGCVITTIGLWIRVFCDQGFGYIFGGHIVAATAQSFFYGTGQKVSAIWFPERERGLATFFILSLMTVGNAVGPLFPEFFIDPAASGDLLMSQLKQMLICTAYIGTGITVVVALLFKEKPKHPPSKIAEIPRLDYKRSLLDSLKNWNLMWAMLTMSTAAGVSIAWVACMEPILKPLGVSQSEISYLLSICMGVGFVVSLVTSFFISKSKKYKFWLFLFGFIANFFLLGIVFSANSHNSFLICGLLLLSMVVGGAPGSMLYEFFVEISFPVAEEVPGSLYSLLYQLTGTGISLAVTELVEDGTTEKSVQSIYVCFGVTVVSLVGFLFVKEDLRRTRIEMEHKAEKKAEEKLKEQEKSEVDQPAAAV